MAFQRWPLVRVTSRAGSRAPLLPCFVSCSMRNRNMGREELLFTMFTFTVCFEGKLERLVGGCKKPGQQFGSRFPFEFGAPGRPPPISGQRGERRCGNCISAKEWGLCWVQLLGQASTGCGRVGRQWNSLRNQADPSARRRGGSDQELKLNTGNTRGKGTLPSALQASLAGWRDSPATRTLSTLTG